MTKAFFVLLNFLAVTLAYGQTTLPMNMFRSGTTQTPLTIVNNVEKLGKYGYIVSSGVPKISADSTTNNSSSTLRLFEIWPDGSAKELGPTHSIHYDISEQGGGRFSHWHDINNDSYYIVFSTSDATDPRTNGRHYLAVQPGDSSMANAAAAAIAAAAIPDKIGTNYDSKTKTRSYFLETTDPGHRTVVVTNSSNYAYSFKLAFNQNGFLQSSEDLKTEIQNMVSRFGNEPIESKIWRFVTANRTHKTPYTGALWYHHPLLFFNSAGWGFCDDAASVLKHTAALFGIDARIWALTSSRTEIGGHIVPEIFKNGSWHLYDPDYGTYFIDSTANDNVASVSSLIGDNSLITNPIKSNHYNLPTLDFSYIPKYVSLYNSQGYIVEYYNELPILEETLTFDLPPGGAIEVGAHGSKDAPTMVDEVGVLEHQINYSSLKVLLPQGSTGSLRVFLIPYMIKGNGNVTVQFDNDSTETIAINPDTNWNINDLKYRNSYIKSITYAAGANGLEIYYLANPIRSSIKNFNSVVLKPSSIMKANVRNPLQVRLQTVQ